jgi:hypothetical protein
MARPRSLDPTRTENRLLRAARAILHTTDTAILAEHWTMQMDSKPAAQIDKLAELTRSLTYGEMTDLAAELWKAAGEAEITAETLPEILHRWASEHGKDRPETPVSTGTGD